MAPNTIQSELPATVELILPQNIIETCYNLTPGHRVEFISSNLRDKCTNHVKVTKLPDHSVKLRVSGNVSIDEKPLEKLTFIYVVYRTRQGLFLELHGVCTFISVYVPATDI